MKNLIPKTAEYPRHCYAARLIFGFVLRMRLEVLREHSKISGLEEFDADKTMRLLDKFWEVRPNREALYKEGKLAYLPVDRDLNAKHGHRVGFATTFAASGEDRQPVLDVMLAYDQHVSPTARTIAVHEEESDFGSIRRFDSQVSAARLLELIRDGLITDDDVRFLEAVGRTFGVLDRDEIVAIGRHESADGTRDAILWELDRWQRATARALTALRKVDSTSTDEECNEYAKDIWSSVSFAYECFKKAGIGEDVYLSDREAYGSAREKLTKAATTSELRDALAQSQPPENVIWDSAAVRDVKLAAFAAWTFSLYLLSCRSLTVFRRTHLRQRFKLVNGNRLNTARMDLRRLLALDGTWQPANFSRATFASAKAGPITSEPRVAPKDLPELKNFLAEAEVMFESVLTRFVRPKLNLWRVQNA